VALIARNVGWKLCGVLTLFGCASQLENGGRDVRIAAGRTEEEARGPIVTQMEMQQGIERFTGEFLDQIVEACEPLTTSGSERSRREGVRRVLVYSASVLDIAAGPYPEVNVLDMIVFIRLSRVAVERYWVPEVFGDEARPLVTAFVDSEERAWHLASKILTGKQREQLNRMIEEWERDHPHQVRVEMVRFDAFSARAGKVTADQQRAAEGLLGNVKAATQAADQALLFAERGMFLAHRLPFVLRLQARVGAQEVMTDSLGRFSDVEQLLRQAGVGRDLLGDVARLLDGSRTAAQEARLTLDALAPLVAALPPTDELRAALSSGNDLAEKALTLLREARALAPDDPERTLVMLEAHADRMLRRVVLWLGLLGAALILLFWGGYYAVRRLTAGSLH
jgi:hypothetical protein